MPGHQLPLNSGIRCPSVGSVENTFLSGMQSSESSFIVTSAVSSTDGRSENLELSSGSAAQSQEQIPVLRRQPAVRKAVLHDVPAVNWISALPLTKLGDN